ncbi:ribokinase [Kosakonia radicincitans DSM 16656]|uniref:Ribokinase n=1 Tax=Kosakonia radicincitans TaxID=283686 RepID=A0AAX2EKY8_9ENTR|nr:MULTISPECIES: ribokinase [Kosakonia]MDP9565285.1 ribokinase [Kosakonia oryzae]APG16703.1 ribokinase [Kosakonia radicincitans]ARD62322.1 ribokinase [Kosakonia radicincitans DSM 16656]KDE36164.1 regulatory protein [Kosakonia radicincitans UMEnt01/12]MDD7993919.1 PfkB family carbohydrate kinase [Kosakonia radicincitans]
MFLEERRKSILQYLDEHERGYVNYFAAHFNVTKETIRSDLNTLAEMGLVQRCYGGAIISRRSLLAELISETGDSFEVLLQPIYHRKSPSDERQKGKFMQGKVCVFGSFNVDIVAKVERFPRGGESLMALGSSLGPGGKGANQATAASKAGAQVHFVAKVGKDQFSNLAADHLTRSAIHSYTLYQSESEPTGNAIIYVSQENGENMIAIYSGANKTITHNEIQAIIPELSSSDVLLVQLENNFDATHSIIKIAHELGKRVILNPAPYSAEIIPSIPFVDVITPNETEASLLSGIDINDLDTAKEAALRIAELGARKVLITMGSRGALLLDNRQFSHIRAFPAVTVDTTGAGDAFNGALAASLAAGNSLVQATTWASAFASLAVELEGASNMPDFEQANARLRTLRTQEK